MEDSNKRLKLIQNAIQVMGMTIAAALDFNIRNSLKIPWFVILLSVGMVYMMYLLIEYNKKNMVTYVIIVIVAILAGIVASLNKSTMMQDILLIRNWFLHYMDTQEDYKITYAFGILFLFVLIITLMFYLINQNRILWYGILSSLVVVLVYSIFQQININKGTLAIVLIFIIQMVVELCGKRYYHMTDKKQSNRVQNLFLFPLCIGIGTIAVVLPSSEKPIQWTTVKQVVSVVSDKIDDISFSLSNIGGGISGDFSLKFVGFSDEDVELGGEIKDSNKVILRVQPQTTSYNRTYLLGNVSDVYTSTGWKRSKLNFLTDHESTIDFYEMLYGMYQNQVVPKEEEQILHNMKLSITYQKIRTKSILYPIKLSGIDIVSKNVHYDRSTPVLTASKFLKKGFSYDLNYTEVNYGSETIQNYLRKISSVKGLSKSNQFSAYSQEECYGYLQDITGLSYFDSNLLNENLDDLLNQRAQVIQEYYTQIPNQVPQRVYNLADEISAPYDNKYDKLKAIETYLNQFTYTKTPSVTKEGEDFVDYFLFEQQEGYCTYFASAMTVMARCLGIPARYVEGVVVNYKDKDGKQYLVGSGDSHAWMEAYIKGFGWVPFEPSSSRYSNTYEKWDSVPNSLNQTVIVPTPEPAYQPDTDFNLEKIRIQKERNQNTVYLIRLCLMIVLAISTLLIGILLLLHFNKKRKYDSASKNEKMRYLMEMIMDCLRMDGYKKDETQTLSEFSQQLGGNYTFNIGAFGDISEIYENIRYGGSEATDQDIHFLEAYYSQLKSYLKEKLGWYGMIRYQIKTILHVIS